MSELGCWLVLTGNATLCGNAAMAQSAQITCGLGRYQESLFIVWPRERSTVWGLTTKTQSTPLTLSDLVSTSWRHAHTLTDYKSY